MTDAAVALVPGLAARALALARVHRYAIGLFALCLGLFAAFSGSRLLRQSKAPHFVYQAAAFLEGRLDLGVDPPNQEDWVKIGETFHVSFPALPAAVMLPFVALHGYQFNDTSFTVIVAALNTVLFFLLLQALSRRGDSRRTEMENALLALLFAFGTVNFYCSIRGEVWFTAEVLGVALTCAYLSCAHRGRQPALAGLAWSAATLTRTPLVFTGAFFAFEVLFPDGEWSLPAARKDAPAKLRAVGLFALGALPLALAGLWFNQTRFGNPFEFGHRMLWNNRVNADIQRWGLFSYQYLERNLTAAFAKLPTLQTSPLRLGYDPHGMSLLVTTPLFLLLLWPRERPRLHRTLWLTVAATSVPGFFYQNDGYMQFGFRFSLDYTPHLFALLAVGGRPMGNAFWALAAAGVAVNTWGALVFRGYSW